MSFVLQIFLTAAKPFVILFKFSVPEMVSSFVHLYARGKSYRECRPLLSVARNKSASADVQNLCDMLDKVVSFSPVCRKKIEAPCTMIARHLSRQSDLPYDVRKNSHINHQKYISIKVLDMLPFYLEESFAKSLKNQVDHKFC